MKLDEARKVFVSKQEKLKLKNGEIMKRLIDILILLVKGGHPLRGHDESEDSKNKGLFLELVNILSKYDTVLKDHLLNGPKNARYTSPEIQNDLIKCLKNLVLRKIKDNVQNQPVSIMADETSDCGHHEQMSIVLRFCNQSTNLAVEHMIALTKLDCVTDESIFTKLEEVLVEFNIEWKNVLCVCYDDARAMSGILNGVQQKCKEKNSKYVTYIVMGIASIFRL